MEVSSRHLTPEQLAVVQQQTEPTEIARYARWSLKALRESLLAMPLDNSVGDTKGPCPEDASYQYIQANSAQNCHLDTVSLG